MRAGATEQSSARDRSTLASLADVLIPAAAPMPSASEAAVAGKWLDRVLEARPNLARPLEEMLARATDRVAAPYVRELQEANLDDFLILARVVSAAYYRNPRVRKLIGYPGQVQQPILSDEAAYDMRDGLLEPVLRRYSVAAQWPTGSATGPPEPSQPAISLRPDGGSSASSRATG